MATCSSFPPHVHYALLLSTAAVVVGGLCNIHQVIDYTAVGALAHCPVIVPGYNRHVRLTLFLGTYGEQAWDILPAAGV